MKLGSYDPDDLISGLPRERAAAMLPDCTILLGYRGSWAHGTYVSPDEPDGTDDVDLLGVCIPPLRHYFGLGQFEQRGTQDGWWDVVVYELRKFVRLLMACNPDVLGLLWLRPQHYLHVSPWGRRLIEARHLFASKAAHAAFCGYARGQLKRMTPHASLGYMGEKRKTLVAKFGYDTKNASHLIRLLRMGVEFLSNGTLCVWRGDFDAEQLVAIKRGAWTLERVQETADGLFEQADIMLAKSPLPEQPNREAIEALLVDLLRDYWGADLRAAGAHRIKVIGCS